MENEEKKEKEQENFLQCIPNRPSIQFYNGSVNGGTLLSLLLSGQTTGYTCAPLFYANLSPLSDIVNNLTLYIDYLIHRLEKESGEKVCEFTIGKTSTGKPPSNRISSPFDPRTWTLKAIPSRWTAKYKPEGYRALIVICAMGIPQLPMDLQDAWKTPEAYALALEQALITHYAFNLRDSRLANRSLLSGKTTGTTPEYFVVYVAFKTKSIDASLEQMFEKTLIL